MEDPMAEATKHITRLAGLTVSIGVILLLVFRLAYPQVGLSRVAVILTGMAILLSLAIERLFRKKA
jgi:hypothetical protein